MRSQEEREGDEGQGGSSSSSTHTTVKMPPANDAALSVVKSYNLNPRIQVSQPNIG